MSAGLEYMRTCIPVYTRAPRAPAFTRVMNARDVRVAYFSDGALSPSLTAIQTQTHAQTRLLQSALKEVRYGTVYFQVCGRHGLCVGCK